jgi:4,5:9,10-diseco-3-hydroxy-5,9,17-trioxoandrosta-1(10),2-diene-4-oate hydrolase
MSIIRNEIVGVEGVSLAVSRIGKGIPIVCLTAIGHDALDFAPLIERLGSTARYQFICIEWPGHGGSGPDDRPANAKRYADLVDAVLWQLNIRNPIFIGNSIGGAVAVLCAASRGARALVLCDSGGLVEVNATVARFCSLFASVFRAGARGAWWFKPLFALYYRMVLPTPAAKQQRHRIVAQAYRLAPALAQAWESFGNAQADLRQLAASLSMPVWVAWARRDRVIPLKACLPAIEQLQQATLDTFDAGHTAFLEQPDEFAEKFDQFVAGLPAVSSETAQSVTSVAA